MELSVLNYDAEANEGILQLNQGPWAGRSWTAKMRLCASPLCGCPDLDFDCIPFDPSAGVPGKLLRFALDLEKRKVCLTGNTRPSRDSLALAKAVVTELQDADWQTLYDYLLATKQKQIEDADVTQLDADFPPEVMSGEGYMVGYVEIFPFASAFPFAIETGRWLADDQYCVNPECRCHDVLLSFIPARDTAGPVRNFALDVPATFYDYKSGKFEIKQAPAVIQPALPVLMGALKKAHTRLDLEVTKRHRQLRTLYKPALLKASEETSTDALDDADLSTMSAPATAPKASVKVGRNDPCPCGSGKKYKKCCGR
jgi:hypothetical protein